MEAKEDSNEPLYTNKPKLVNLELFDDLNQNSTILVELKKISEKLKNKSTLVDIYSTAKKWIDKAKTIDISLLKDSQIKESFLLINQIFLDIYNLWLFSELLGEEEEITIKIESIRSKFLSYYKQALNSGLWEIQAKYLFDKKTYVFLLNKWREPKDNPAGNMNALWDGKIYPMWHNNKTVVILNYYDNIIPIEFKLNNQEIIKINLVENKDDFDEGDYQNIKNIFETNKESFKKQINKMMKYKKWENKWDYIYYEHIKWKKTFYIE